MSGFYYLLNCVANHCSEFLSLEFLLIMKSPQIGTKRRPNAPQSEPEAPTGTNAFLTLCPEPWPGNAKTLSSSRVSFKNTFLILFPGLWPGNTKAPSLIQGYPLMAHSCIHFLSPGNAKNLFQLKDCIEKHSPNSISWTLAWKCRNTFSNSRTSFSYTPLAQFPVPWPGNTETHSLTQGFPLITPS